LTLFQLVRFHQSCVDVVEAEILSLVLPTCVKKQTQICKRKVCE